MTALSMSPAPLFVGHAHNQLAILALGNLYRLRLSHGGGMLRLVVRVDASGLRRAGAPAGAGKGRDTHFLRAKGGRGTSGGESSIAVCALCGLGAGARPGQSEAAVAFAIARRPIEHLSSESELVEMRFAWRPRPQRASYDLR